MGAVKWTHTVLGVLEQVLGVLHRVLGVGVLEQVLGVLHRVLGVVHEPPYTFPCGFSYTERVRYP